MVGDLALTIVGDAAPGYGQVEAICHWIHAQISYQYGTSIASTSALDTIETHVGVCRDFAHLGIALCRSLNIPARMVVGYLHGLKPMDLHAWFEAFWAEEMGHLWQGAGTRLTLLKQKLGAIEWRSPTDKMPLMSRLLPSLAPSNC